MARPQAPSERSPDNERNTRLVEWLATEKRSYLLATARRAGAPEWQLQDVVQAGLLDFYRAFPGPDVAPKALAYCAACVASQAWKARRRYARKESREQAMPVTRETGEPLSVEDVDSIDPADLVGERERYEQLRKRLDLLPEDQRAVVILAAAGYSPAAIAEIRELSVRQVRKRIEKANRSLRNDH